MKQSIRFVLSILLILTMLLPLAACNADTGAAVPSESTSDAMVGSISGSVSLSFSSSAFESVSNSVSFSHNASLGAAVSDSSASSEPLGGEEPPVEEIPGPEGALLVYDGSKYCVNLIKSENTPADVSRLIMMLSTKIDLIIQPPKGLFPTKNDTTAQDATKTELVIGGANRPLNTSVQNKLGVACAYEYRISETGGYIIGTIDAYTKDGIQAFMNNYLEENLVEVGGKWYLLPTEAKYVNSNPSFLDIAVLSAKLNKTFSYTSATQCNISAISSTYKIAQGATIDPSGTYLYISMINSSDASAIGKYKLDGTKVKTVTGTGTDHSNDMAYNSKDNTIIVAHNTNNQKRVTVFDTNLNKLGSYETPAPLNGIGYNADSNIYAAGISGGSNFYALNSNFGMAANMGGGGNMVDTGETKTRQGMDCDADYVYFVQSAGTKSGNIILVYNWSGGFLCRIELTKNSSYEAETIMYAGGKFYLWCNKGGGNGGILYKLTATMPKLQHKKRLWIS